MYVSLWKTLGPNVFHVLVSLGHIIGAMDWLRSPHHAGHHKAPRCHPRETSEILDAKSNPKWGLTPLQRSSVFLSGNNTVWCILTHFLRIPDRPGTTWLVSSQPNIGRTVPPINFPPINLSCLRVPVYVYIQCRGQAERFVVATSTADTTGRCSFCLDELPTSPSAD